MTRFLATATLTGLIAGLLATPLALAQPAAPDWSQAKSVTITLSNFAFDPADLRLVHGQPYRLHFVNTGSGGHNFAAKDFFAAARIDPADAAAIADGKVELEKGQSRDVRLVPATGSYKVKCSHFMHTTLGMKGVIHVD